MHRIYSSASRVIIFLGLDKGDILETFNAITEIGQYYVNNHRQQQAALVQSLSNPGRESNVESSPPVPSDNVFATAKRLWSFSSPVCGYSKK
jgi:hypothetical protein